MDIRLICFDLGGVLIDICHEWKEAITMAGVQSGNDEPGSLNQCPVLVPYQGAELSIEQYLKGLGDYLQISNPMSALAVHNSILKEERPGVLELVKELKELGFRTACLSNTNAPHWREMQESGRFPVFELLDLTVASHELGLNKPDLEIFRQFERLAECTPDEIAFFDDHQYNVTAAQEAGWHAARVDSQEPADLQMRAQLISWGVLA